MSARALLEELEALGVELRADGDHLEYEGPEEEITPELLDRLTENKHSLIKLLQWERRKLEEASRRGLIIRWSEYPTWIKLHDPLTGEWHEVRASECLPSIVEAANRRGKKGGAA